MATQSTKHQPATALPWAGNYVKSPKSVWGNVTNGQMRRKLAHVEIRKDAQYIAHAANAYPELIRRGGNLASCVLNWRETGKPSLSNLQEAQESFDALLRELGELT